MTVRLTIRKAGLADVKAVWEIEKLSFPAPWSPWAFVTELGNPLSRFLVAGPQTPDSRKVWGYIIFWVAAQEMHILNLAAHPHRRRRGVGRALLAEALRRAREEGAGAAWLEVRPSNTDALKLYESFGFMEVGVRPKYYGDNQEDALVLFLALD